MFTNRCNDVYTSLHPYMVITLNECKFLVFYEWMYNLCDYLTCQCVFFFFFSQIMWNLILWSMILPTSHDLMQDHDFDCIWLYKREKANEQKIRGREGLLH